MSYTIKDASFDEIDARTRIAATKNGFGVRTKADAKAKMKKLEVEMPADRILSACNPEMAHQAI